MAIILLRGGFELYEFIRTHFYPEKNWPLARDILEWMPWYWWVIAVLCLLVIFLFEGGFHAVRNRDKAIALQSDINKIPQSGPMALGTPDSPIITEPVVQIHLDNFPYATGYGLTDGFPNESSPDTFWVKVFAEIEITQNANIETLELLRLELIFKLFLKMYDNWPHEREFVGSSNQLARRSPVSSF
jgi:hypothetical protein